MPASLKQLRLTSPSHHYGSDNVTALAWSPDGQTLAQGSGYNVRLWSPEGKPQRVALQTAGNYLDWSSDGTEVFAGGNGKVTAHSTTASRPLYASTGLHPIGSLANGPDGRMVIISRMDGHLQIVDPSGQTIREVPTGGNAIPFVAWCHATNTIAVAEPGQPLKFLDPDNGWTLKVVNDKPLPHFEEAPVWSPDGRLLWVGGHAEFFDADGQRVRSGNIPPAFAWRPDGERYLSFEGIYDRSDTMLTRRNQQGLMTTAFDWSPRGNLFAIGTTAGRFTVWQDADFQPYWHGVLLPDNKTATFSPAGELLDGRLEEIDPYLVYYLDRGDGRIETLTPAEFREVLTEAPPTTRK